MSSVHLIIQRGAKSMKKATATKALSLIWMVVFLFIIMPGRVVTAQVEAIPNGDYTINSNGAYQLPEGYAGIITIASGVTEVTVTDAVYQAHHNNTSIVLAGKRGAALALTVEDIDIAASSGKPGIDFGGAGSYENRLYTSGTCHITGGAGNAGVYVPTEVQLVIDKIHNDGSDRLTAAGGFYAAGIGGGDFGSGGTITINGGTVTATGGNSAAGIGGGEFESGGTITINGGTVTATGGNSAAGIGGGEVGSGGTITINGGTVTATGGDYAAGIGGGGWGSRGGGAITINGGTVTATGGDYGVGIGGGEFGSGGTITISGGTVTATGGDYGAGIGGGGFGSGGTITISGGTVTAAGGDYGAGIGGGLDEWDGTITISGGTVTATGGVNGAGIGGYGGSGGAITINGGTVTATGGYNGAGIGGYEGSGGTITISGGTVTATGGNSAAGIGGWGWGPGGAITINGGTVTATGGDFGAGIGGGRWGPGGDVRITGTPVVYAEGSIGYGAEHIGKGAFGSSGTLKNGSNVDLSYIRFSTSGVAGAKIGLDGIVGEYLTNNQGISGQFVTRNGSVTYTASKAGYAAVRGTQVISSMNYDINITMEADNTPTNISSVNPTAMRTGTPIVTTFNADYGLSGTLYLVPKAGTAYTNKAALDGVTGGKTAVLNSPATTGSIDTTGLAEGSYQVYLVDSAENVSAPSADIVVDNTPPEKVWFSEGISSVNPSAMRTGTPVVTTFNDDYGLSGTLYLVPKAGTAYTNKAALDGVTGGKTAVLNSPATTGSIDTTGLAEGSYQVYLVDSAENVSAPSADIVVDNTPPEKVSSMKAADDTYIDVEFSEGIFGAADGVSRLTKDKLELVFAQNGGTTTGVQITSIKKNDRTAEAAASELEGGEIAIRVFLEVTGLSSGIETIEIKPLDGGSIFDNAGNAMPGGPDHRGNVS